MSDPTFGLARLFDENQKPRAREVLMPLTGIEAQLSDNCLRRLIAYEHLLGPYRPTRPIVLSIFARAARFFINHRGPR